MGIYDDNRTLPRIASLARQPRNGMLKPKGYANGGRIGHQAIAQGYADGGLIDEIDPYTGLPYSTRSALSAATQSASAPPSNPADAASILQKNGGRFINADGEPDRLQSYNLAGMGLAPNATNSSQINGSSIGGSGSLIHQMLASSAFKFADGGLIGELSRALVPYDPAVNAGASPLPRIAGPAPVPAIQAPWYTPEAPPRLGAPSAGPISRAAGMSPGAAVLAGGAAATAAAGGTVAANPDYFTSSIGDDGLAANILTASRDNAPVAPASPPQRIADVAAGLMPVSLSAQRGGASGDWENAPAAANPPQKIADVAPATTDSNPADARLAAGDAPTPWAGLNAKTLTAPAAASGEPAASTPIAFATFGGGADSSKAHYHDGSTAGLKAGQPLPADVQQFNQVSAQAAKQDQPVSVIRGLTQTVAFPNGPNNPMREAPVEVVNAGQTEQYFKDQAQGMRDAVNPADAKARGELAKQELANKGALAVAQLQYQAGKVPPGYRATSDGKGVEPIPGSEADQKNKDRNLHLQNSVAATDGAITSIDQLISHPGRTGATGSYNLNRFIPGTDSADFAAKLETLKAQTFLPQVEQLKGMGALSDAEGKKLTAAVGALDYNMSEKGFLNSLGEIRNKLEEGKQRVIQANPGVFSKKEGAGPTGAAPSQAAADKPSIPDSAIAHLRANPGLRKHFEAKYGVSADSYLGQ